MKAINLEYRDGHFVSRVSITIRIRGFYEESNYRRDRER